MSIQEPLLVCGQYSSEILHLAGAMLNAWLLSKPTVTDLLSISPLEKFSNAKWMNLHPHTEALPPPQPLTQPCSQLNGLMVREDKAH